ncbi:MAG: hypothetical protein IKD37_05940 [Clostridia bacterium]|nr:hypothetical protein [Clostridia bacterium]
MVLSPKQTTIAYRCPRCGAGIMSAVGFFSLSGDMLKLKCDCGESELIIQRSRDGKIRLTVPCILCPKPHQYTVSSNLFFGRELFTLACPYSDLDTCFIGETNHVKAALAKNELELLELLEEAGAESFDALNRPQTLTDPQIYDIILFVIRELEAEGEIHCRCAAGEGEYTVDVLDDCIRVSCTKCGAEARLPTDSLLSANAFLNADRLQLS